MRRRHGPTAVPVGDASRVVGHGAMVAAPTRPGRVRGECSALDSGDARRAAPRVPAPPRRRRARSTSGSRSDDGLELSVNLWLPVPRPDALGRAVPGDPRDPPVPQGRLAPAGDERRGGWLAARGFALCRLDVRGTGSSPGVAARRVHRARDPGRVRGRRVAGGPAVVATATSGCGGSRTAASPRSRSPSSDRPTSGRSSRCTRPTTATPTTSTTSAGASRSAS